MTTLKITGQRCNGQGVAKHQLTIQYTENNGYFHFQDHTDNVNFAQYNLNDVLEYLHSHYSLSTITTIKLDFFIKVVS